VAQIRVSTLRAEREAGRAGGGARRWLGSQVNTTLRPNPPERWLAAGRNPFGPGVRPPPQEFEGCSAGRSGCSSGPLPPAWGDTIRPSPQGNCGDLGAGVVHTGSIADGYRLGAGPALVVSKDGCGEGVMWGPTDGRPPAGAGRVSGESAELAWTCEGVDATGNRRPSLAGISRGWPGAGRFKHQRQEIDSVRSQGPRSLGLPRNFHPRSVAAASR